MVDITLICVGKMKEKFYSEAAAEYVKRLGGYCKLSIVEIPEQRLSKNPSLGDIQGALEREGDAIRSKIPANSSVVALAIEGKMRSSGELAELIRAAMPAKARREKQHPAKRSFQAIRIAVNDELGEVERLLGGVLPLLKPGGRLAIISFHSLEDRLVKTAFGEWARGCTCPPDFPVCVCGKTPKVKLVGKRPITASEEELNENPRARSAKLRIAEKR